MFDLVGDRRIEDLPIKTVVQVTDMETGLGMVLTEGSLAQAMYASSALTPFSSTHLH